MSAGETRSDRVFAAHLAEYETLRSKSLSQPIKRIMKQLVVILILVATPSVVTAEIHHVQVYLTGYEGMDDLFLPANFTVSKGDTVTWHMNGDGHRLQSGDRCFVPDGFWNSGLVPRGSSYSVVFDTSFLDQHPVANDKYVYHCGSHACGPPLPSVTVVRSVPTHRSTWGRIKNLFQSGIPLVRR